MRYVFMLVALAGITRAQAQQVPLEQAGIAAQANLDALVSGAPALIPSGAAYGVKGSPYLENRWLPTRLRMGEKVLLAPVATKYDVLNKRVLMQPVNRPNDSLELNARLLTGFEIQEPGLAGQPARVRTFRRFVEAPVPVQQADYVEVLHEGKYALLKRHVKTLRKANYQGAYSSGNLYDEIEDRSQYYLKRPDKTLVPLKLTLKMLQAAAPQLAAQLKAAPGASQAKSDAEWAAVLKAVDPL
ncbi:hypothetical protein KLP40_06635 [Hymenobacter sp. NST-14]|uniref:hypothetical protein n=1 Tax=Hymenobacter piscis TaxID=2839984 RepID=UPI001C021B0F|nr:hypothetical protein [Hymenobacter piscis]MBT9392834.1 hypothetical protein [Hymenobacter piscis]